MEVFNNDDDDDDNNNNKYKSNNNNLPNKQLLFITRLISTNTDPNTLRTGLTVDCVHFAM